MWLVVTLVAAIIVTILHFKMKTLEKYRLNFLALMLWGTFVMVLVDHTIAWLEGGQFIEITTGCMIPDATILGILMIIPLLTIWIVVVSTKFGARICAPLISSA